MEKLEKLRETFDRKNLDAILITNPINRRYVTGFTGSAGVAIISRKSAIFITDSRYIEQAKEQATEFVTVEHTQLIHQEIKEQLNKLNISNVGFEKEHLTYAAYEQYQKVIDQRLIPVAGIVEQLRLIKSDEEIVILKKAAEIADAAFEHIQKHMKPGVKELDIANELEFFMRKKGAASSSFDIIVASGKRSALPHGVATEKEMQDGELVTLDYGALYQGYCSDITRTVAIGEISDELKSIYHTVLEAQRIGVNGIKPGITGKEADALARDYIEEKGFGQYFGHSTGHGFGMDVHEGPGLSYRTNMKLEQGMTVTVEPGIYIPGVGGCRIEDDLVITKTGNERLTKSSKDLIYL